MERPFVKPTGKPGPNGIGGWLILPLIGLVIGPFLYGYLSYALLTAYMEDQTKVVLLAYGLQAIAVCLFAFYCLVRFFQKKVQAPALISLLYLVQILEAVFALLYTNGRYDTRKDFIVTLIASSIWIAYFRRSKRVANTFVR